MTRVRMAAMALSLVVLAACSDEPTGSIEPTSQSRLAAMQASEPVDVPELRFTLPPRHRAWDDSDSALVAAIAAEDGHATIAFRQPGSNHGLRNGIRSAITASNVEGALRMLSGRGIEILRFSAPIGVASVRMDPALAPQLKDHPLVDFIEPRQWGKIAGVRMAPNARMANFSSQVVPWGVSLIRAPEAWTLSRGTGATVWIVDTPYDRGHEDLPIIPDGNCFWGGCAGGGSIPHGSHVLGILTARDNDRGVVGGAPDVLPENVGVHGSCSMETTLCTDYYLGIVYAAWRGARVINMSVGLLYDASDALAVAYAWDQGAVLVAAAGNDEYNKVVYPAGYDNVIGVSGVRPNGSFAETSPCYFEGGYASHSSNWGQHVDLAGPFWALSTVPGGYQDEHDGWCGNSMATPYVSAAAALVRSRYPAWTNAEVVMRLFTTAQGGGTRNPYTGFGVVDAAAAVGYTGPPTPPFTVSLSGTAEVRPYSSCLFSASPANGANPFAYAWTADGIPTGDGSGTIRYTAGSTAFQLAVAVTDGQGRYAWNSLSVAVSWGAPECLDQ